MGDGTWASRVSDRSLITQLKKNNKENNNKKQGTVKWVGFLCQILQFAKISGFIVLKVNSEVRQDPKFNLGLPNAYKLLTWLMFATIAILMERKI